MSVRNALVISRHVVWMVAAFTVLAALVRVRLDVADLRARLDRSVRELEASEVTNGRLAAELDARRRAENMQLAADTLGLLPPEHVLDLGHTDGGAP